MTQPPSPLSLAGLVNVLTWNSQSSSVPNTSHCNCLIILEVSPHHYATVYCHHCCHCPLLSRHLPGFLVLIHACRTDSSNVPPSFQTTLSPSPNLIFTVTYCLRVHISRVDSGFTPWICTEYANVGLALFTNHVTIRWFHLCCCLPHCSLFNCLQHLDFQHLGHLSRWPPNSSVSCGLFLTHLLLKTPHALTGIHTPCLYPTHPTHCISLSLSFTTITFCQIGILLVDRDSHPVSVPNGVKAFTSAYRSFSACISLSVLVSIVKNTLSFKFLC